MEKQADAITVMVIDDERDIRDGSERILSRIGFRVLKANTGENGLELLKKERPAIVLLDLKMPGMDGMEVLSHIRAIDESIVVIVITGYATVETAIQAMKQGAYDFIPKPFEPDQLRIVISRATEKIQLTRDAERTELKRRRTLADLDTEKSRMRTIVESLPYGLMVTNTEGRVVLLNPAFRQLLGLSTDIGLGEPVETYLEDKQLCNLIREISRGKHVDFDDIPDHEFSATNGKFLLARGQPVLGERRECLGSVINCADITDMKVLDRLKSEFVAKVSHELRSPLSTIHEQLALVIRDMVEEPSAHDQHILSRAQEKTKGLIAMIGDLLDLSRIEEGLICHEPKQIRLEEVIESIVEFLRTKAEAAGQTLTLSLSDERFPELTADPLALESIFGNLISNAIQYTPKGGTIRVEMDMAGINLRVKVIDNGFGIEEKHLDKIFERFYRVKDENTRYITGTGLGLPIVKGLVDTMGGVINVNSEPGVGTAFTVLLPTNNK